VLCDLAHATYRSATSSKILINTMSTTIPQRYGGGSFDVWKPTCDKDVDLDRGLCHRSDSIESAIDKAVAADCYSYCKSILFPRVRKFCLLARLPQLEIGWGVATIATSSVQSYKALYALRFLLLV